MLKNFDPFSLMLPAGLVVCGFIFLFALVMLTDPVSVSEDVCTAKGYPLMVKYQDETWCVRRDGNMNRLADINRGIHSGASNPEIYCEAMGYDSIVLYEEEWWCKSDINTIRYVDLKGMNN